MCDFEIIEGDENNILSLKRISDGVIFKIGDDVSLIHSIQEGTCDKKTIQKFMTETDRNNKFFPVGTCEPFPSGTIIVETGVIQLENAGHSDFTSEIYKIMNTPLNLSVRELNQLTNFKYKKKFMQIAKEQLKNGK